jgi:hypothetical protein
MYADLDATIAVTRNPITNHGPSPVSSLPVCRAILAYRISKRRIPMFRRKHGLPERSRPESITFYKSNRVTKSICISQTIEMSQTGLLTCI